MLVEGTAGIFIVGRYPSRLEKAPELERALLEEIPTLLVHDLEKAMKSGEDIFEHMGQSRQWNFYLSEPQVEHSAQALHEVAFGLFVSAVLTRGDAWTTQDILPSLEPGGFIETVPAPMPVAAVG